MGEPRIGNGYPALLWGFKFRLHAGLFWKKRVFYPSFGSVDQLLILSINCVSQSCTDLGVASWSDRGVKVVCLMPMMPKFVDNTITQDTRALSLNL